jgi:glycerophosphoryl diester phosphodiesterase
MALALFAVLALITTWYSAAWLRRGPPLGGATAAIAHRGAPGGTDAAEGTLAAFQAAADAGAEWLEFDVRRTSDGVLVVLHDANVDRTTDGTGPISNLTLAQVHALDAGGGATIPTVEEVVGLAATAGLPILPEIKDGPSHAGVTGQLVDLLRARRYLDRAVIQAFEAETLLELRRLAPEAKACWLTGLWQFDLTQPPADAAYICPMGEMVLLHPEMIRSAHASGRVVFAWWGALESPAANAVLAAYGVDGIMMGDLRTLD